jgi:hypothetical protein
VAFEVDIGTAQYAGIPNSALFIKALVKTAEDLAQNSNGNP